MFGFPGQEDNGIKPMSEEDQQILSNLVQKYGVSSLNYALTGYGDSSRASIYSTSTLLSSAAASISAPSLAWTSSEAASQCRSDGASIHTQYTWPEAVPDIPAMPDIDATKVSERSWLDSPAPIQSPHGTNEAASHPSPRLVAPTGKKYQCPMCYLDSSPVGFGRKSDFKKHLHNFHGADVVWICWTKGCNLSFTTERAYSTHAKEAHRMKALSNSAARTDLCPQLVFACGFGACKDRVFEANSADESSATRDKHFEHIAKHFEDGYDISTWEYRVQVQNLLRQQQVKPVWKSCVFPKEKRQGLTWKPRSSGDLKRILESRHLGSDISNLVRLAYILGNAPYTSSTTPPPGELEMYFQMPYRDTCPVDKPAPPSPSPSQAKPEDDSTSSFRLSKCRSSTQTVFKLPSRSSKRISRPPTPSNNEAIMADAPLKEDEPAAGPQPGMQYQMPNEQMWPAEGPKYTQDPNMMNKGMEVPHDAPMMYAIQSHDQGYGGWNGMDHGMDTDMHQGIPVVMDGMHYPMQQQPLVQQSLYNPMMNGSQTSVRPGTPTPIKRPGSWSRMLSMENLRPSKKMSSNSVIHHPPQQDMSGMIPNNMGM